MKKILKLKHSIATFDNFVDPKDCKKLIEIFEKQKDTQAYTRLDGEGTTKAAKDDVAMTFSKDNNWPKEIDLMCKHLTEALGEYIKATDFINFTSASDLHFTNVKIQKTKPGGGYHVWHVERSHAEFSCKRALVWTIYLNDIKKGGETEFLNQNERVEPKAGRICIFPADFPYVHRGNPPLQEDKYILTSWFLST
jgi:hypothetical protein|tara:strand:- start:2601 stop:3185 length:585 start_codon:yes stop_codon:yes gene_type:complete